MKIRSLVLTALCLSAAAVSCSSTAKQDPPKRAAVVFDDRTKTDGGTNTAHTGDSVSAAKSDGAALAQDLKEQTAVLNDNSRVVTSHDGSGNSSVTRTFDHDPAIRFILVRTSREGQKLVYVYGQTGQVTQLPDEMRDRALSASANEIATALGLREVENSGQKPASSQSTEPLRPLPSSEVPIRNPAAVETTATKTQNPGQSQTSAKLADQVQGLSSQRRN